MRGTKLPCSIGLRSLGLLPAIFASSLAATASFANTYSWNSLATGATWNVASNWSTGGPPISTNVAEFNSSSYALQPSLTAASSVGGLWDAGIGTVSISGSALTLNGGVLSGGSTSIEMDSGAGAMTISASLALGNAQTWLNNSAGSLTVSGNLATNGNTLTTAGNGVMVVSGTVSGTGGLTVNSGMLALTGSTLFSGSTSITGGTLSLGLPGGTVRANTLLNTAGITIGPGATIVVGTLDSAGAPNGPMVINGLFLKGLGAFADFDQLNRPVTLSNGTIQSADAGGGVNSVFNTGSPSLNEALVWGQGNNARTISTSANTTSYIIVPANGYFWLRQSGGSAGGVQADQPFFTTGANSTLNVNASLAQYNNAISVGDGVNISGSGTVVFAPPAGFPSQYCRNTNIISGTLQVGNTGAIPYGLVGGTFNTNRMYSNVELDGGATAAGTLDLHGNSIYINGLQGLTGTVLGTVTNGAAGTTATLTDLTLSGGTFTSLQPLTPASWRMAREPWLWRSGEQAH